MKIIKILSTDAHHAPCSLHLKTSASLIAGVLSFGCMDANADIDVNTSGNAGITSSGLYVDENIKMYATRTTGIKAENNTNISLSLGSIKNNAVSAAGAKGQVGISAAENSHISLTDTTVLMDPKTGTGATVTANDMRGIVVNSGSRVVLDNTSVILGGGAKGNNNGGAVVSGDDAEISLKNSSLLTSSWGAVGVAAGQGGRINLTEGTKILTTGTRGNNGGSHGITVESAGSQLYAENASINTTGGSAYGVKATEGGKLDLKDTAIYTGGGYGHGVVIDGPSEATISGGLIQTTGKGATGLWARSGANVNLQNGGKIETSGAAISATAPLDNEKTLSLSHVLLASGENTVVTGRDLQLTSSAVSASAVRAEDNARISLFDTLVETTGTATSTTTTAALHALSGAAISGTGLSVDVSGTNQGGIRAEGANSEISLVNSTVSVSGPGNALHSSAAARAISGASVSVTHSALTTTGMTSHGVSVEGAGSRALIRDTTIETRGARSSSVNINDGASAEIYSSKMLTTAGSGITGPWSPGILLQGAGSSLLLKDSEIFTTQSPSGGISAGSGSQLEVNTSRITTSGDYGTGIGVANSTAVITNSHINTSGNDNAMGIVANGGATVTVTGGSVTTTGNGSPVQSNLTFPHALASRSPGAMLTVDGTTLVTKGAQAYGATADDGGSIILRNLSVKTLGENSIGLYAGIGVLKPGSVGLTATNVSVETLGDNAAGAFAGRKYKSETAEMALDGVALATHGDNSLGLWAEAGAGLTANNTVITTDGALSHGILASNGGRVQANNVVVTAHGENAAALAVQGTDAWTGQANLMNTTLSGEHGHGIETTGYADITMQNSRVTGERQWLQVNNGAGNLQGHANINLSGSVATGAALTQDNAHSEVALNNTSLWFLTDNSVLGTLSNNQSLIHFSTSENHQYKSLTVNNYHGDNGTIALNTHLHDDNSPSDQVVINRGHADGSTNLKISNTNGSGALTRGNGIKVVDAINGGTTTAGAFSLLSKVKAGPYQYTLYRSSVDGSNEQAWYLRSHKETDSPGNDIVIPPNKPDDEIPAIPPDNKPDDETPAIPPDNKPDDEIPAVPSDNKPDPGKQPPEGSDETGNDGEGAPPDPVVERPVVPDYRAETSLYKELPQLALLYNRMLMDSLHERTGEQFASPENIKRAEASPSMSWGRAIYKKGRLDLNESESRFTLNAIQLGIDLYRRRNEEGRSDFAGVTGSLGKINSKVTHAEGEFAGRNALKSWGAGVYWTHFTPSGTYLDAVAQYNRYYAESSPHDLATVKTKGYGLAASLETGYPWQPDKNVKRFVEPQAQLVYSTAKLDRLDDDAATVNFSKSESLTGRVSLRFHQTWDHNGKEKNRNKQTQTTLWLRPGLLHEFKGKSSTEFSSQDGAVPFTANTSGTSGQVIAGKDHQFNNSVSLTGTMSYEKSLAGENKNYGGIVGIKIKF